jgi:hypothetical protein
LSERLPSLSPPPNLGAKSLGTRTMVSGLPTEKGCGGGRGLPRLRCTRADGRRSWGSSRPIRSGRIQHPHRLLLPRIEAGGSGGGRLGDGEARQGATSRLPPLQRQRACRRRVTHLFLRAGLLPRSRRPRLGEAGARGSAPPSSTSPGALSPPAPTSPDDAGGASAEERCILASAEAGGATTARPRGRAGGGTGAPVSEHGRDHARSLGAASHGGAGVG